MTRRIVISLALGVVLVLIQLVLVRTSVGAALLTGLIAFVVAFLVLLVSDRWFSRTGRR